MVTVWHGGTSLTPESSLSNHAMGFGAWQGPFDYLTELQRHSEQLKRSPAENYREALARLAMPAAA